MLLCTSVWIQKAELCREYLERGGIMERQASSVSETVQCTVSGTVFFEELKKNINVSQRRI